MRAPDQRSAPGAGEDGSAAAELPASRQYLTFRVGGEIYAFAVLRIKEIIEYDAVTSVPLMPACIRGVINLRGTVVPVVDLHSRFGREPARIGRRTCIVIIEMAELGERQDIGVMVDAVNEVIDLPAEDIQPAPAFGSRIRPEFIAGMGSVGGRFIVLLDASQVLAPAEIARLARPEWAGQGDGAGQGEPRGDDGEHGDAER